MGVAKGSREDDDMEIPISRTCRTRRCDHHHRRMVCVWVRGRAEDFLGNWVCVRVRVSLRVGLLASAVDVGNGK